MKVENNFNAEIKPQDWLYIIAALVIIVLIIKGDMQTAIHTITEWIKVLKQP